MFMGWVGGHRHSSIHETHQKLILDMAMFNNSRKAFSSSKTHTSRNRFYLVFLFSSLARFS